MANETGKFSICDNLIEASWLDKDFKYAYSKIEPDSTNQLKIAKWVLFAITDQGYNTYDLNGLVKKYGEKKVLKLLNSAKFSINKTYSILYIKQPHFTEEVWSSYRIFGSQKLDVTNTCLYLPKKKMVWVFDTKNVKDSKLENYFNKMPDYDNKNLEGGFKFLTYYDINFDGKLDFFDGHSTGIYISNNENYNRLDISTCVEFNGEPTYVLSDKKNIFIGNNRKLCNISELVR